MDKVKLGRALGYGTRHALKTLAQVADAATTPTPPSQTPRPTVAQTLHSTVQTATAVHAEARKAKRSMFTPLRTFSSVLWLQVTGVFFGLFAMSLGTAVWRLRAAAYAAPSSHEAKKFYIYAGLFAVFAYFTISSFARARRRERR